MPSPIGKNSTLCKAKTRSGELCKNKSMANGRCRLHGGKSSGPPLGSKNALTHGIYSSGITAEEGELWDILDVTSLDEEIKITKIRLRRALAAEIESRISNNPTLEIEQLKQLIDPLNPEFSQKEIIKRRPDYNGIVDRITGRLANLITARDSLSSSKGKGESVEQRITEFISQAVNMFGEPLDNDKEKEIENL